MDLKKSPGKNLLGLFYYVLSGTEDSFNQHFNFFIFIC